jgi:hypothetical protein
LTGQSLTLKIFLAPIGGGATVKEVLQTALAMATTSSFDDFIILMISPSRA